MYLKVKDNNNPNKAELIIDREIKEVEKGTKYYNIVLLQIKSYFNYLKLENKDAIYSLLDKRYIEENNTLYFKYNLCSDDEECGHIEDVIKEMIKSILADSGISLLSVTRFPRKSSSITNSFLPCSNVIPNTSLRSIGFGLYSGLI